MRVSLHKSPTLAPVLPAALSNEFEEYAERLTWPARLLPQGPRNVAVAGGGGLGDNQTSRAFGGDFMSPEGRKSSKKPTLGTY